MEKKNKGHSPFFVNSMKKNDKVIGECVDYTHEGLGVVKIDGFCLFVKNMCIGDIGEIVVTLLKKNHGYGRLLSLTKRSVQRVEPVCPIYKHCGGCQLQHIRYEDQLNFKRNHVENVIKRIGKIDCIVKPVIGMDVPYYYRNKVQVPVGRDKDNKIVSGFYRNNTHEIIDLENCSIQSELSNQIYAELKQYIIKNKMVDVRHILLKHAFQTNEVMVVLIVKQFKLPKLEELISSITQAFPMIQSIVLNLNQREDNVILGEQEKVVFGKESIEDHLMGLSFAISSKSFYQVNPIQTEKLYQTAIDYAELTKNETVVDVYCGIGTIGMSMSKYAKQVIGIEVVKEAIEDAKENAKRNQINNIEFICGDAGVETQKLIKKGYQFDVVVVDPPRKGCDENTIQSIVDMSPKRIVYVSCDPATLARDLAIFSTKGYKTVCIQPVDMFPQTKHIENVVKLVKE